MVPVLESMKFCVYDDDPICSIFARQIDKNRYWHTLFIINAYKIGCKKHESQCYFSWYQILFYGLQADIL